MKKIVLAPLVFFMFYSAVNAQSNINPWVIKADKIDPYNYYGVTVANGMVGVVSSAVPFKVKDVVLNGAFDLYGRGRVSNILKTFNFLPWPIFPFEKFLFYLLLLLQKYHICDAKFMAYVLFKLFWTIALG